ncbi:MAG: 4'-phosphopantetheinyl transferase superfamily protein [Pseudomonas sp.]|uniref:4'-phosphopantetheinyl transferase family protein n=1 Tax=Pseudomonas sp. TaxID=306 RepID=UPI00339A1A38
MNLPPLPACCTPLDDRWPLPFPVPGARLLRTRFDPALWQPEDFPRQGIAPARGVAKRQSEFLAGRICARAALLQLTGHASVPAVGDDGAPQWPPGLVGSITHGAGWAAAVVAPASGCQGLGLDLEQLLSAERAERLAEQILTANELQRLQQLPQEQRALLVTLTFSLKESLFKALYPLVRTRFYFEHAELLEWSTDGRARLRLLIDLSTDWHQGRALEGQFSQDDDRLLSLVAV